VAKAAPDGYTLLSGADSGIVINPHVYGKLGFDPLKDLMPIASIATNQFILAINPKVPARTLAEFVALARAQPGKLSFGSGSSSSRVAGEMFKQMSGTEILHVPYKSNPMAVTDLLGGQIDMMITDTATGIPQIKAGKLKPLGYSTQKRSALLPDVPTIDEAGVKGYDMGYWFAAYVPAGTPQPVVARLHELLVNATKSAAAKQFYETAGAEAWTTTPEELAKFQQAETQKWGKVIKAAGIEPE